VRAVSALQPPLRRPAARRAATGGPAPPGARARGAAQAGACQSPTETAGVDIPAQLGGAAGAAALADHAFFQYERALQREADPTLVIDLPRAGGERAERAAAAGGGGAGAPPAPAAALAEGGGGAPAAPPPAEAAPADVGDEGGPAARRQLEVGVEYAAGGAGGGLCFWGAFVRSAGEVRPRAGSARAAARRPGAPRGGRSPPSRGPGCRPSRLQSRGAPARGALIATGSA